jgi:hypothetical protein
VSEQGIELVELHLHAIAMSPPWIGRPYVTAFTLNRLAQRDIETVINNVVGNRLIPANILQDIIERTKPPPPPALPVPASLQASLMARLDRLGSAKEVAQIGATLR